jgi:ferredoxin
MAMTQRIVVNPIACVGHGICAELLPERITLDDWGFPIIDPAPIPPQLAGHARRVVAACPTLALAIVAADDERVPPAGGAGRKTRPQPRRP